MAATNAHYLPFIGRALDTAEKASLQCSIPLLSARFNGCPAEFWGKVCGYKNDYLVAHVMPTASGALGPRIGFYSVDGGNNWTVLDELTDEQAALCQELRGVYQGVPAYEYKVRKDIPPPEEPEVVVPSPGEVMQAAKDALAKSREEAGETGSQEGDEEEEDDDEERDDDDEEDEENDGHSASEGDDHHQRKKKDRSPKYLVVSVTEARRLSHFVQLHDAACRLAVRGEYVLSFEAAAAAATSTPATPSLIGAVRNRAFGGMPLHYALKPSCYLRLHAKGKESRNAALYGSTYNPHTDFLAPITDDPPQGVWSVKYDATLNAVAVTNWFYEGSLFWYRPGTLECGQIYHGNGQRNFELFLML